MRGFEDVLPMAAGSVRRSCNLRPLLSRATPSSVLHEGFPISRLLRAAPQPLTPPCPLGSHLRRCAQSWVQGELRAGQAGFPGTAGSRKRHSAPIGAGNGLHGYRHSKSQRRARPDAARFRLSDFQKSCLPSIPERTPFSLRGHPHSPHEPQNPKPDSSVIL